MRRVQRYVVIINNNLFNVKKEFFVKQLNSEMLKVNRQPADESLLPRLLGRISSSVCDDTLV